MTKREKVVAEVARDETTIQENIVKGVNWLDTVLSSLPEFSDADHHIIPVTGEIFEI
jgi:hypothetical protein|tara:strand:+ start:273 stop:443 length:171 start_codon:yes stop_codon:yes gene_type:complete